MHVFFRCLDHCDSLTHKGLHFVTIFTPKVDRLFSHPKTTHFDPSKVGLNVRCDNMTHRHSDPFSAHPGRSGTVSTTTHRWCSLKTALRQLRALHQRMGQLGASLT
jgi:hypothetical protein